MQFPVSTKTALPQAQTSPTSGILSGRAGHGIGKRGLLPVFAEILSDQSEETSSAEGIVKVTDQLGQGDLVKKPEGNLQQEFAVEASRVPEVQLSKTAEDAVPKTVPHAHSSFEKDKAATTKAAKKDRSINGQFIAHLAAGSPQNSNLQIVESTPIVTSLPVLSLHLAVIPSPMPGQPALSLSPLSPSKSVPPGIISPHLPSSSSQSGQTIESLGNIAGAISPVAQVEPNISGTALASLSKQQEMAGPVVPEKARLVLQSESVPALPEISEQARGPFSQEHSQGLGEAAKHVSVADVGGVSIQSAQEMIKAIASHTAAMPKAFSAIPGSSKLSHDAVSTDTIATANNAFKIQGDSLLGTDVTAATTSRSGMEHGTVLPMAENKTQAVAATNPFQRLDAGEPPSTLLHASTREVTVGVQDPSLGWVEIQTQSSAGHVTASLTAASNDAHANLATEVPALAQYLADRNVHVSHIDVGMQSGSQSESHSQSDTGHPDAHRYSQGATSSPSLRMELSSQAIDDAAALEPGRSSYISIRA